MSDVEHLFMCLLAIFGEMSVYIFSPFFDWVVCFSGIELHILYIIQMSWLCVLEINPSSVVSFAIFFSHS